MCVLSLTKCTLTPTATGGEPATAAWDRREHLIDCSLAQTLCVEVSAGTVFLAFGDTLGSLPILTESGHWSSLTWIEQGGPGPSFLASPKLAAGLSAKIM